MATTYGKQYVDFDMDFTTHPSTGDLSTVKKSTAIKTWQQKVNLIYQN